MIDGWITLRLTYDDVLFGWDEVLEDIKAITDAGRHRARSARMRATLAKSLTAAAREADAQRAVAVERGE